LNWEEAIMGVEVRNKWGVGVGGVVMTFNDNGVTFKGGVTFMEW
jgi:hypothetical protein